jgi:hypothetical protein
MSGHQNDTIGQLIMAIACAPAKAGLLICQLSSNIPGSRRISIGLKANPSWDGTMSESARAAKYFKLAAAREVDSAETGHDICLEFRFVLERHSKLAIGICTMGCLDRSTLFPIPFGLPGTVEGSYGESKTASDEILPIIESAKLSLI